MKILITGGLGFIGTHLCYKLLEKNHEIVVIDNLSSQIHGNNPFESETFLDLKNKIRIVTKSVTEFRTWTSFFNDEFDSIICLAAETGTGQSMFEAYKYCNTNINSIALLNDLILGGQIKTKQVILASSRAVYGDASLDLNNCPIATKETDKLSPKSIYAITKLAQEQILFSGFGDVSRCALRFQNVYGPKQSLKNPYTGIISIFSTAIKNKKDIQVFEDGMMSRDFVYIDDVIESIIITLRNKETNGQVYNVGSGIPITVKKVAEVLRYKFNSDVNIIITGERIKGDIKHNFADISKIKEIGYEPNYNFEMGIKKFVDWVNSKGKIEYNGYESSLDEFRKKGLLK